MAQIFSAVFFILVTVATVSFIVSLLRAEQGRIAGILSGRELREAQVVPQVRVRLRSSIRTELRRVPSTRLAAAA